MFSSEDGGEGEGELELPEAPLSLDGAFETLTQALGRMQEAVLARERRVQELEEAMGAMELRVERGEEQARSETERLEGRLWRVEESVQLLERKLRLVQRQAGMEELEEVEERPALGQLDVEGRVRRLEATVRTAMASVSPSDAAEASTSSPSTSGPLTDLEAKLFKAVEDGRADDLRALLEAGVSPNVSDSLRMTPLHVAATRADARAMALLVGAGANVAARTSFGNSPLHLCAAWDRDGQCVALLLEAGAALGERGQNGYSPLHWAAVEGNEVAARTLLAAGASTSAQDDAGLKPLDLACGDAIRGMLSKKMRL